MQATFVRPALLRRITCTNARNISTRVAIQGNNLVSSSRPGSVKTWATDVTHRALAVRYVSEEAKNKVNIRKEAVKRSSTIEDRVKKIVAEQLGVRDEEVCTTRVTWQRLLCHLAGGINSHMRTVKQKC